MKLTLVLIMCCAITLLATGAPARAGEAADRFVAEFGPHAGALRAFYTGCEARYRFVVPAAGGGRQQETMCKIRYDHDGYVLTDEGATLTGGRSGDAPRKSEARVAGRNRQYAFNLSFKAPGEYAIRKVTIFADGPFNPNDAVLCPLCFPYADPFLRLTYLEMVTDPEHTVTEYTDAKWRDGRPVKEVKVRRVFLHPTTKQTASYVCSYFFDPANGWVCVGNQSVSEDGTSASGEVFEYEPAGDSLPAIKRWGSWSKKGNGPEIQGIYSEALEFRRAADLSEKEFRLTAFGLPEPMGVQWEKPAPRYRWFLAAAAGFVVLAVGFRYLARRRARAVV